MMLAAKTITATSIDIFNNNEIIEKAIEELNSKRKDNFLYTPLISRDKPPLDYRK